MKGKYIVIEGAEGVGKTTQLSLLISGLQGLGYDAIAGGREPGGTSVGEQVRSFLLDDEYSDQRDAVTQVLGYNFARAILVRKVIARLLNEGKHVISDRCWLSTIAYQGFAEGVGLDSVMSICEFAVSGYRPDKIFILDVPVEIAYQRLSESGRMLNYYDYKPLEFQERVRDGYQWCATRYPELVTVLDGDQPTLLIAEIILDQSLSIIDKN